MNHINLLNQIKEVLINRSVDTEIKSCKFEKFPKILKRLTGVYIIFDTKLGIIVYVGKGIIFGRFKPHYNKATGLWEGKRGDTNGWKWFRNNNQFDIHNWKIFYVELPSEKKQVAVEGMLIDDLEPLANDETFKDRLTEQERMLN